MTTVVGLGSSLAVSVASHHGVQTLDVLSGSMAPNIRVGDLVVAHEVAPSSIKVGDVITFREPFGAQLVFTHRVVGITRTAEGVGFSTKGDNNAQVDPWTIRYQGPAWRVAAVVPAAGNVLRFIHSGGGRVVVWISLFALVLMLLWPVLISEDGPPPAPAVLEVVQ